MYIVLKWKKGFNKETVTILMIFSLYLHTQSTNFQSVSIKNLTII